MLGLRNSRAGLPDGPALLEVKPAGRLRAGSRDPLLVLLEVLDLLHRKVLGTCAGCGTVGRKRAAALRGVKEARAIVAPEIPIQVDCVKTARDISLGEVEAVSGQRTQD